MTLKCALCAVSESLWCNSILTALSRILRCTFISFQLHNSGLLQPLTYTHNTCQKCVWEMSCSTISLFHTLCTPLLLFISLTLASSLVSKHTHTPHSKLSLTMMSLFVKIDFIFIAKTVVQLSPCWVTHECHLFKKPSAWIYIPTLWSPMSLADWMHNGEGWVWEKLAGIRRKNSNCFPPTHILQEL